MQRLTLEEVIEHFDYEDVSLSRRQLEALFNLFEPTTGDLISMEQSNVDYIVRHFFNKTQKNNFDGNRYVFAETVMRCLL